MIYTVTLGFLRKRKGTNITREPESFTQSEPNLVSEFGYLKSNTLLIGSKHHSNNLLSQGTSFYWNRNREKEFK